MWHSVISWQELKECEEHEFTLEGAQNSVAGFTVHFGGEVYAYHNLCPHQHVYLNWSPNQFYDREHRYLMCSTHGALFEPKDGLCVSGPCVDQSLQTIPARVNADQVQVYVELD